MIGICDYGSGNVQAIANIYTRYGIPFRLLRSASDFTGEIERIILPGVGAFDETISLLRQSGLVSAIEESVLGRRVPFLGICVGMQVLAGSSEEGRLSGLGWIPGQVKRFDKSSLPRGFGVPHLGWNSIKLNRDSPLFHGVDTEEGFYFIHSYYFDCDQLSDCLAWSSYGRDFACVVNRGNIFGVQFHPEKSHENGVAVLVNFAGNQVC